MAAFAGTSQVGRSYVGLATLDGSWAGARHTRFVIRINNLAQGSYRRVGRMEWGYLLEGHAVNNAHVMGDIPLRARVHTASWADNSYPSTGGVYRPVLFSTWFESGLEWNLQTYSGNNYLSPP